MAEAKKEFNPDVGKIYREWNKQTLDSARLAFEDPKNVRIMQERREKINNLKKSSR